MIQIAHKSGAMDSPGREEHGNIPEVSWVHHGHSCRLFKHETPNLRNQYFESPEPATTSSPQTTSCTSTIHRSILISRFSPLGPVDKAWLNVPKLLGALAEAAVLVHWHQHRDPAHALRHKSGPAQPTHRRELEKAILKAAIREYMLRLSLYWPILAPALAAVLTRVSSW